MIRTKSKPPDRYLSSFKYWNRITHCGQAVPRKMIYTLGFHSICDSACSFNVAIWWQKQSVTIKKYISNLKWWHYLSENPLAPCLWRKSLSKIWRKKLNHSYYYLKVIMVKAREWDAQQVPLSSWSPFYIELFCFTYTHSKNLGNEVRNKGKQYENFKLKDIKCSRSQYLS